MAVLLEGCTLGRQPWPFFPFLNKKSKTDLHAFFFVHRGLALITCSLLVKLFRFLQTLDFFN